MRLEMERFHLVLSNIHQKLLTRHIIVTYLNGKKKKSRRREEQIDHF